MANKKPFRVRDRETKQLLDIYYPGQDVNVNTDGTFKALPEALGELQEEINEAGTGNYTKPPGGIPYSDLSQDVRDTLNEVADKVTQVPGKGLSTNDYTTEEKTKLAGLSNYNDAELRQQITRLQTALDNLMNGESVTDAIDTFTEIVDFLNEIDTDDQTLFNQLKSLNEAITALRNTLSTKANSSDVANTYATKRDLTSGLSGKQDTLTPGTGISLAQNGTISVDADNTPTPDSPKPVTSGGVSTALQALLSNIHIGQNGNWWVGPETDPNNDTGIKAQGPKGNSVVDGDTFHVINNLIDGGEGDALSAEMGKTLMVAIQQILGALGNYAFPGGKPTIDWGGSSSVTYSVTYPSDSKVTHTGAGDTVELGSSLEVTLGIASGNDLYAIKDSSVKVYMGGVEQSGAYNASTQKVTLAAVTGNVVIVAEAWTYVSRGLVMHLDGRNRGGTAGKWKSLVDYNNSPLYFKLENCDEQSDYVAGNGTNSKGTAFSNSALTTPVTLLDVGAAEGTIEAAYSHAEIASNGNLPIMHNALGNGNRICLTSWHNTSDAQDSENSLTMCTAQVSGARLTGMSQVYSKSSINTGGYISLKQGSFMFNGNTVATAGDTNQTTTDESKLSIFYRRTTNDQYSKYRLYALRVYSVQLTDAERAQNLAIDQKRFNL